MKDKITITFNDQSTEEFDVNTPLYEIARSYQDRMENFIIGVKIENKVVDMNTKITKDTKVNFFDMNDLAGYKMYQAALKFVMSVATKEVFSNGSVIFEHSIDKGIMCRIKSDEPVTDEKLIELKTKMEEIIKADLPIKKINVSKKEAVEYFNDIKEREKAVNIHKIANQFVVLYKLKDNYNYFYIDMPYSTGVLTKFDILPLEGDYAVLLFPSPRSNNEVPKYTHNEKIIETFKRDKQWIKDMEVKFVTSFNELVAEGKVAEFVRMNELFFSNKIQELVYDILKKEKVRTILIAGPSSSGKTTTTERMATNLRALGKKVFMISVDNYYKDRKDVPRLPNGEHDLESINALDTELFNKHLYELLEGRPVVIPTYDFKTGTKSFNNKETTIDESAILLIEGLHCLNEELTKLIPRDTKYKVYLSPFTPLCTDRHNHVSTVDIRLIRRMIRDNRTRGSGVSETIRFWQNVRLGEEKHIFPHIKEADAVMNTALIYELGVLKVYAEPILFSVEIDSPYYEEARRLVSFLNSFFPVSSEYVPRDSILREFIGGSIYEK